MRRFRFPGGREAVKWQSSQAALDMLRRALVGAGCVIRAFVALLLDDALRAAVAAEIERLRPLGRAVAWVPAREPPRHAAVPR